MLSWGACPTIFIVPELLRDSQLNLLTAFGDVTHNTHQERSDIRMKWQQELLAYGSAPWILCRLQARDDGVAGRGMVTFPHGPRNPLHVRWQAQWWRWHARRARRACVAYFVSCEWIVN